MVVIDEIQESARVYSLIRQFAREFQCHFAVAGSYLGKTVEKEYFLPAGDTVELRMDTLCLLQNSWVHWENGSFMKRLTFMEKAPMNGTMN